jgi:hypothetical protein
MNKLTAEKCSWLIRQLKSAEVMSGELSIADHYKLQALQIALPVLEQREPAEWTDEQCLEFLSIAFRHAKISGDIIMDDIRLAVKMVNAAPNPPKPSTTPQIDNDGREG